MPHPIENLGRYHFSRSRWCLVPRGWGGPVAIAVSVDDGKALRRYRRQLERLRERGDSSGGKVARPPGGGGAYPINRLRNIASTIRDTRRPTDR